MKDDIVCVTFELDARAPEATVVRLTCVDRDGAVTAAKKAISWDNLEMIEWLPETCRELLYDWLMNDGHEVVRIFRSRFKVRALRRRNLA